jgi:hypothetical protein
METEGSVCLNCGGTTVLYRVSRQQSGRFEVVLRWDVCPLCRQISLRDWTRTPVEVPAGITRR